MELRRYRALRPLTGDYGRVDPGEVFTTNSRDGDRLEARGLVELVIESRSLVPPENKMMPELPNKAMPNPQPAVAPAAAPIRPPVKAKRS